MGRVGDLAKEKILEAALELLVKHGLQGTSFQMIADACGLKQTNVLYHFKDKEILVEALVRQVVMRNHLMVEAALKPTMDARQRSLTHMQTNWTWCFEYPDEAKIILLLYYGATHNARLTALYQTVRDRGQQRLLEYILAGRREGFFKLPEAEASMAALLLHHELNATLLSWVCSGEKPTPKQRKTEWQRWDYYVHKLLEKPISAR